MDNIRPIRTEADYAWAIAEITRYFDNEPEVGSPDGDRFDVLATLIEAYEDRHYPISAPDPVETIVAHMEMAGLTQGALAELLGSRSRASEILHRKRPLTMDMAYRLHTEWHIPAEALLQPYQLEGAPYPSAHRRTVGSAAG
jgi:HTH-type transcriptional regulator/antitoxin HigA